LKRFLLIILLLTACTKSDIPSTFCWYCETSAIGGGIVIKTEVDNLSPDEILIYAQGLSSGLEHCIKGTMQTVCIKKEGD